MHGNYRIGINRDFPVVPILLMVSECIINVNLGTVTLHKFCLQIKLTTYSELISQLYRGWLVLYLN